MTIVVYKKENDETKEYSSFNMETEYDREEARILFANFLWNGMLREDFGDDFFYVSDWLDYVSTYDTQIGYSGEGIYQKGKQILSVDILRNGLDAIDINNVTYFI